MWKIFHSVFCLLVDEADVARDFRRLGCRDECILDLWILLCSSPHGNVLLQMEYN